MAGQYWKVGFGGQPVHVNPCVKTPKVMNLRFAHLIVDQAPLLQERMNAHDGANITCQVTTTSSHSQIFDGVQSVGVDHEISVVLVSSGSLAAITAIEEFCEGLLFDRINGVHIEPSSIAGENNGMGLRDELLAGRSFQRGLGRCRLVFTHGVLQTFSTFCRWL